MKCIVILIFLLVISGCKSQPMILTSKQFNELARSYFLDHYSSFDLSPLTEGEKCVLEQTIRNDLDELNDCCAAIVNDNFMIKSYYEPSLHVGFAFILDQAINKMYFICLPNLEKYLAPHSIYYKRKDNTTFILKDPVSAVKINSSLFGNFFANSVFEVEADNSDSFYQKKKIAKHILKEVYRSFYLHEGERGTLIDKLDMLRRSNQVSQSTYSQIINLIDINARNRAFDVLHFELLGYCIFAYSLNPTTSNLQVDVYFIPEASRPNLSDSYHIGSKYRECFSQP